MDTLRTGTHSTPKNNYLIDETKPLPKDSTRDETVNIHPKVVDFQMKKSAHAAKNKNCSLSHTELDIPFMGKASPPVSRRGAGAMRKKAAANPAGKLDIPTQKKSAPTENGKILSFVGAGGTPSSQDTTRAASPQNGRPASSTKRRTSSSGRRRAAPAGSRRTGKSQGRGSGGGRRPPSRSGRPVRTAREQQVRTTKRILALVVFFAVLILCLVLVRLGGGGEEPVRNYINAQCESYRPQVERIAAEYRMGQYVDLILALMMQESSGVGPDVMQSSEGGFNTQYPQEPGGITDPEYSIRCGIQELKYALERAGSTGPKDLNAIRLALQAYNFGTDAYMNYLEENQQDTWSQETAEAFAQWASAGKARSQYDPFRETAGPWDYGDQYYPEHVLRYYPLAQ